MIVVGRGAFHFSPFIREVTAEGNRCPLVVSLTAKIAVKHGEGTAQAQLMLSIHTTSHPLR